MMDEKDALEANNTNLESEIQRTLSMRRYLESQLKDRFAKSSCLLSFHAHTAPSQLTRVRRFKGRS